MSPLPGVDSPQQRIPTVALMPGVATPQEKSLAGSELKKLYAGTGSRVTDAKKATWVADRRIRARVYGDDIMVAIAAAGRDMKLKEAQLTELRTSLRDAPQRDLLAYLKPAQSFWAEVERPNLRRIKELEARLQVEEPGRCVQDVAGSGACFFLAANLGRQACMRAPRTSSSTELDAAGRDDRRVMIQFMLGRLDGPPLRNRDTLRQVLAIAAIVSDGETPPFPGALALSPCLHRRGRKAASAGSLGLFSHGSRKAPQLLVAKKAHPSRPSRARAGRSSPPPCTPARACLCSCADVHANASQVRTGLRTVTSSTWQVHKVGQMRWQSQFGRYTVHQIPACSRVF